MLAAVSGAKNREKCCSDCAAGVCKMCKVHVIIHVHTLPPPCIHTHVDTLHAHAHPANHKALLEGEGKGSRVAKGSWGGRDGVECTPRHILLSPF
jgi:hypothetical protein